MVRYPEREADQSEWEDLPTWPVVPGHHVAVRAPDGTIVDVRGVRDDRGWKDAPTYYTGFEINREDREMARRLLTALRV